MGPFGKRDQGKRVTNQEEATKEAVKKVNKSMGGLVEPVEGEKMSEIAPTLIKVIAAKVGKLDEMLVSWEDQKDSFSPLQLQLHT